MINWSFKEWLDNNPMTEATYWIAQLKTAIMQSIRSAPGFISVSISSLIPTKSSIMPTATVSSPNRVPEPQLTLAASIKRPGTVISEITEKGWKGKAAMGALGGSLGWSPEDQQAFAKAMSAGRRSLPQLIGKQMGLLFEIEVFIFIVQTYKLRPLGEKNLAWTIGEKNRLTGEINGKLGDKLGKLAGEFIVHHATSMAQLIYSKAITLVKECKVDSIEFTGGTSEPSKLKSDTADLRIGCEKYITGIRKDVGFSLKAVTETQIEVRHFSVVKALKVLGVSKADINNLQQIYTNPLYEDDEKRAAIIDTMETAAKENYQDNPKKFARLLELLVTGGADTIPAYRMLLKASTEPGWSGAIGRDFITGEGPGRKLKAKPESTITVKSNPTYLIITYTVPGGNYYGTSVKFEPDSALTRVSAVVSNLTGKGGRGY